VCVYNDATAHGDAQDAAREIVATRSSDGGATWDTATTVVNTADEDTTFGSGVDENGDVLVWCRHRGVDADDITYTLRRSTDHGETWSQISTPTLDPLPTIVDSIIHIPDVPTVGDRLMCWWSATLTTESERSYGVLYSDDNGTTWTQVVIATGVAQADQPTEVTLCYLGAGKIIGLGRNEDGGPNVVWTAPMLQATSDDHGDTWTVADSNITDSFRGRAALELHGTTLRAYHWQRRVGILWMRQAEVDDIFAAPTVWPAARYIAGGAGGEFNAGYPDSTRNGDDEDVVAFYTGNDTVCTVRVAIVPPP
jgi:Neuraminidase (sialidase)